MASERPEQRLGIIGGSGAYDLLTSGILGGRELGRVSTPYGESAPLRELILGESATPALFLSRHGESGYAVTAPYVNYRANIYALKSFGMTHIIGWSGPGAIDDTLDIGGFIVPDDLLDETQGRASTFFENKGHGFIRQNPVFCPDLRTALLAACSDVSHEARDGATYVCTRGPRLETPAEIRKFRLYGAHLVGMTLCPEAFLARELAMGYAAVCYVTNYAEGIRERPYEAGALFEGLATPEERDRVDEAVKLFPTLMARAADAFASTSLTCACHAAMDRFIRSGRVSPDWRTWL